MSEVGPRKFYKKSKIVKTCYPASNNISDGSSSSDEESGKKESGKPPSKKKVCQMIVVRDEEIFGDIPSDSSEDRWPCTIPEGDENISIPETDGSGTKSNERTPSSAVVPKVKRKRKVKSVVIVDRYASTRLPQKPTTSQVNSHAVSSFPIPRARRRFNFSSESDAPPPKTAVLPSKRSLQLTALSQNTCGNEVQPESLNISPKVFQPLNASTPFVPESLNISPKVFQPLNASTPFVSKKSAICERGSMLTLTSPRASEQNKENRPQPSFKVCAKTLNPSNAPLQEAVMINENEQQDQLLCKEIDLIVKQKTSVMSMIDKKGNRQKDQLLCKEADLTVKQSTSSGVVPITASKSTLKSSTQTVEKIQMNVGKDDSDSDEMVLASLLRAGLVTVVTPKPHSTAAKSPDQRTVTQCIASEKGQIQKTSSILITNPASTNTSLQSEDDLALQSMMFDTLSYDGNESLLDPKAASRDNSTSTKVPVPKKKISDMNKNKNLASNNQRNKKPQLAKTQETSSRIVSKPASTLYPSAPSEKESEIRMRNDNLVIPEPGPNLDNLPFAETQKRTSRRNKNSTRTVTSNPDSDSAKERTQQQATVSKENKASKKNKKKSSSRQEHDSGDADVSGKAADNPDSDSARESVQNQATGPKKKKVASKNNKKNNKSGQEHDSGDADVSGKAADNPDSDSATESVQNQATGPKKKKVASKNNKKNNKSGQEHDSGDADVSGKATDNPDSDSATESVLNQANGNKKKKVASKNNKKNNKSGQEVADEDLLWRPGDLEEIPFPDDAVFSHPTSVKSPVEYFNHFFDDTLIDLIVRETNLYSTQETSKCLNVTKEEIRSFFGVLIYTGICHLPAIQDYWSAGTFVGQVANVMPRKRYQDIHRMIHFHNNEEEGSDRLIKVRPLLEHIRQKCQQIEKETKLSVDERMQGYKGTRAGNIRQYLPDKPGHKWGFKIFVLAGKCGMTYNFIVYCGSDTFSLEPLTEAERQLGTGASAVIALCKNIEKPEITTVTFDNWYTGLPLIQYLKTEMNLHSIGTIRRSRTKSCPLTEAKAMKLKGRGWYESQVNKDALVIVQWLDNKPVCIASSFAGVEPLSTLKRYCKEAKAKIDVPCPRAIQVYNSTMGGVDLGDMFMALYSIPTRARRWYFPLFGYCLEVSLANSWLMYQRDCKLVGEVPEFKTSKHFRLAVSQGLTTASQRTKGRPSLNNSLTKVRIKRPMQRRPHDALRLDDANHWPQPTENKGRCKYCQKGYSRIKCTKCEVQLCLLPVRNCFFQFHSDKTLNTSSVITNESEVVSEDDEVDTEDYDLDIPNELQETEKSDDDMFADE